MSKVVLIKDSMLVAVKYYIYGTCVHTYIIQTQLQECPIFSYIDKNLLTIAMLTI